MRPQVAQGLLDGAEQLHDPANLNLDSTGLVRRRRDRSGRLTHLLLPTHGRQPRGRLAVPSAAAEPLLAHRNERLRLPLRR
jgi:hypothetical protein